MSQYLQGRGVHVDRHLTQIALNYRPQGFIADQVFPVVTVRNQTDMIKTYNQADLFRVENTRRTPGTEANKIGWAVSSDSYIAFNYALKADVTIEDRANADPAFLMDFEEGRVMVVTDKLNLDWENRVSALCTTTTNVGTAATVSSAWTDYTNSRPLNAIWTMMDNLEGATGYRPNRIVMGGDAWLNFSRNDKVIDKINETGVTGAAQNATPEQAARLLGVDNLLVGWSFRNTAQEGQSIALSRMWGDHVFIYYAPPRPSVELPAFGYTLRWAAPGLANMTVERHPYDTVRKCDELEIGYYQAEKILAKPLGALIYNVTSNH